MTKTLILIPTYNESKNVELLYYEIKKNKIKSDILFVDDNSPDGTSKIIAALAKKDKSVKLLTRKSKQGIGSAHKAGIDYAYKMHYQTLITMDSDFTHKPKDILKFMAQKNHADIIVGSRYLAKDSLSDWNFLRKALTVTAHFLTKTILSIKYDATGAFRLYNLDKIPQDVFKLVESNGYSFFFESLYILLLNGLKIREVSISLPARTYGSSKMSLNDAWKSLTFLFQTYYLSKIYKDSYIYSPQFMPARKLNEKGEDEWDEYWRTERKKRKVLYDALAVFYRKYIIKRTLNHYLTKTFKKGAFLLHAGCGGGQVDEDVVNYAKITALDISIEALNRYKWLYKNKCKVVHGSIFKIPSKNQNFDGIYNLGVMEHLTDKEIKVTLDEFNRILKKNGKILLFWPPAFGASVLFLNTVHFILNGILKKNIRLHPHEITKVTSRKQIGNILARSGFELEKFDFGPRDFFTYTIIVGKKLYNR